MLSFVIKATMYSLIANLGFMQSVQLNNNQSITTIHDFALNLNNKTQTDVILLDFCKAFNKVSHHLLLHKLDHYSIRGFIFEWISSFLTGQSERVVCNDCVSDAVNVISGVPQGTFWGPYYFLHTLYIYTLLNCITSCCSRFADDCLLYRQINNKNDKKLFSGTYITWNYGQVNGWCLSILISVKYFRYHWKILLNIPTCYMIIHFKIQISGGYYQL